MLVHCVINQIKQIKNPETTISTEEIVTESLQLFESPIRQRSRVPPSDHAIPGTLLLFPLRPVLRLLAPPALGRTGRVAIFIAPRL